MKSNKKFPPALGAIVDQALKDKSAWIGKTVQELTCEAIRKRGLSQENTEGCVCLTLNEAKRVQSALYELLHNSNDKNSREWLAYWMLIGRIEQVEATKICEDYNKALNRVADEFQKQEEIINLKCEIEQLKAEQEVDNYLKNQFLKSVEDKE